MSQSRASALGKFAVIWGLGGFLAMLAWAIARLIPIATDSASVSWTVWQHATFYINVFFMAWVEGYRGFQLKFSPRFAARAAGIAGHATPAQALLAPLLFMSFFHAPPRRILGAILLTLGIIVIVIVYRQLPQPWRGILDAGVVVGLSWGFVATFLLTLRALRYGTTVDPEFYPLAAAAATG
ncbi:MAG: hypothetical protein AAGJ86_01690 [Pseudomonadota bacterium]